jgi:hypothetical protein
MIRSRPATAISTPATIIRYSAAPRFATRAPVPQEPSRRNPDPGDQKEQKRDFGNVTLVSCEKAMTDLALNKPMPQGGMDSRYWRVGRHFDIDAPDRDQKDRTYEDSGRLRCWILFSKGSQTPP